MVSGVGVLDKSVLVIEAVQEGARTLAELTAATGLSRATAHRLAVALEAHNLLRREADGGCALGWRLVALGRAAEAGQGLIEAAEPILRALRDRTGESAQLYLRDGDHRVCVAASESPHGLRTIVSVGAVLPVDRGSAGHVLLDEAGPRGWLASVAEREVGVASVSAPVHGADGTVIAAIGVSGPIERTTRHPGRRYGEAVVDAARALEAALTPGGS
jgi:DNA-binding IclR family transcriptional regulator